MRRGFGSYGFPESHAASFALIAYASSWVKCHHPDVFLAAILNAQPMGFYAPAQLVRDAREHGVEVRRVDVNLSQWDCTLEPADGKYHSVRLGFCMVGSMRETEANQLVDRRLYDRIAQSRTEKSFHSVEDIWRRAGVPVAALTHIAAADGFRGMGHSRREALWAIKALRDEALPLFAAADDKAGQLLPEAIELPVSLPDMTAGREVVEDYRSIGLSLRQHPVAFLRPHLKAKRIMPCLALRTAGNGSRIELAGLVLVRQMPGSAKGVMFITLEDETANANLIVRPQVFEENRRPILHAKMMACYGRVQHASGVTHLIVERVRDLSADLRRVSGNDGVFPLAAGRGDEAKHGGHGLESREPKAPPIKPRDMYEPDRHIDTLEIKARNFH